MKSRLCIWLPCTGSSMRPAYHDKEHPKPKILGPSGFRISAVAFGGADQQNKLRDKHGAVQPNLVAGGGR